MKTVEELMVKDILTAPGTTTLEESHQLMEDKKCRHLLILDDKERLAGILSDRDIKKFVSPFADSEIAVSKDKATLLIPIGKIMSKNLITINPRKTVKACVQKMLENSINSLPVLNDDGKLVGMVTSTTIFEHMLTLL